MPLTIHEMVFPFAVEKNYGRQDYVLSELVAMKLESLEVYSLGRYVTEMLKVRDCREERQMNSWFVPNNN